MVAREFEHFLFGRTTGGFPLSAHPGTGSKGVRRDDLAAGTGGDGPPDAKIHRVLREDDMAVAVKRIHSARMKAPRGLPAGVVIDDAVGPASVGGQVVVIKRVLVVAVPPARSPVQ